MNILIEKYNKLFWTATILIALTIFYMSSLTFFSSPGKPEINSIIYHMGIFFFLSLSLFLSTIKLKNKKLFSLTLSLLFTYGILDELHQFFTPGRFMSLQDILKNTTGIILALIIYNIFILLNKSQTLKNNK